jgi:hypothetical protein
MKNLTPGACATGRDKSMKNLTPGAYATGRNKSMKNPDDPIGNSTRDLPNCSAVRQANTLPSTLIQAGGIWELAVTMCGQYFAIGHGTSIKA